MKVVQFILSSIETKIKIVGILVLASLLVTECNTEKAMNEGCSGTTQYIAFQLFASGSTEPTGAYQPLPGFISTAQIEDFFKTVKSELGSSHVPCRRAAVIIGPLALDFSDTDINNLIDQSFTLATTYDIAVGFHVDDGMFWAKRDDLWKNPDNVEWTDWNGTANTSRYVDWVTSRLAPEMCFNAPDVKSAVKDFMTNIASSIKSNVDKLAASNKADLYAGTIVGWETSLDKDRDTQKASGFHAMANEGYSASNLPADIDQERVNILHDYIEWMAAPFQTAGLPVTKTYTHIAFLSKEYYDYAITVNTAFAMHTFSDINNFSLPEVATGTNYTVGFSTYPETAPAALFNDIYMQVAAAPWVSSEGANIIVSMPPVSTGYSAESFLARHFNHGCTLVNLFAFHLRGDPFTNAINDASEGPDAIAAYKKFLSGTTLKE